MKQGIIPLRARILAWWIMALGLAEIGFGLLPIWDIYSFSGDYMVAAFVLFLIFFIGIITLVSGIFLLKRKNWAWTVSILMIVITIIIMSQDLYNWLCQRGGTANFFPRIFDYQIDSYDILYVPIVLLPLLISFVMLLFDRKSLVLKE